MFVKSGTLTRIVYPSLICKNKTNAKEIWLTFDDGPDPDITNWILSILKSEKIKATFFLIGSQIKKFPDLVSKIEKNGHLIANHSFSHFNGWNTNTKKYIADIEKCQALMPNNKLFRPPYGKITSSQIKFLKNHYKLILWDILSMDFNQHITSKKIKKNVINNIEEGSIIVFHNNSKSYEKLKPILKEIIIELKQKGYTFSTTW